MGDEEEGLLDLILDRGELVDDLGRLRVRRREDAQRPQGREIED